MEELLIVNATAMQTTGVGDYVYRVEQPSAAMGKLPGITVINITTLSPYFEKVCLSADILVLHLLTEHDLLPIVEERKQKGMATLYEISDNFIAIRKEVAGVRSWFSDPVNLAHAYQFIQMADAVQVTGQGLKDIFGYLNPNTIVFENQIMKMGDLREPGKDAVVVGWGGSVGHAEDLRFISHVVEDICKKFPYVQFSFMGHPEFFESCFSGIPKNQTRIYPPGTLQDYFHFLDTLDIGLAPMLDTPYNQCRSDVKFLEYASRGVVPVLSSMAPYLRQAVHGENSFLFRNPEELNEILGNLIVNPKIRKETASNAYEYVRSERMEDRHSKNRAETYHSFLKNRARTNLSDVALTRLQAGSNAFDVSRTNAELLLRNGIETEAKGDVSGARIMYQKASEDMPGYYLPLFWLGYSCLRNKDEKAIEYFHASIQKNPRSLRSLLYLGNAQEDKNKKEALLAYGKAISISPLHASAYEAIGKIHEKDGDNESALEYFDASLKANPFFSNGALGLGRIFSLQGNTEEALHAFHIAADMAPTCIEPQFKLAGYFMQCGNYLEAARYCLKAMEIDPAHPPTRSLVETLSMRFPDVR